MSTTSATDPATRQAAFLKMMEVIGNGGRVVVGAERSLKNGAEIGRTCDGRALTILRRATREEFEACMPQLGATPERLTAYFASYRPAFYYELEVWDRIVSGPGGRLAIRIIQPAKASNAS